MEVVIYACMGLITYLALVSIFFKLDKEDKIYIIVMTTLATILLVSAFIELINGQNYF